MYQFLHANLWDTVRLDKGAVFTSLGSSQLETEEIRIRQLRHVGLLSADFKHSAYENPVIVCKKSPIKHIWQRISQDSKFM